MNRVNEGRWGSHLRLQGLHLCLEGVELSLLLQGTLLLLKNLGVLSWQIT